MFCEHLSSILILCSRDFRTTVKQYYGKEVKSHSDVQTGVSSCSLKDGMKQAKHVREAFALVHPDVTLR